MVSVDRLHSLALKFAERRQMHVMRAAVTGYPLSAQERPIFSNGYLAALCKLYRRVGGFDRAPSLKQMARERQSAQQVRPLILIRAGHSLR